MLRLAGGGTRQIVLRFLPAAHYCLGVSRLYVYIYTIIYSYVLVEWRLLCGPRSTRVLKHTRTLAAPQVTNANSSLYHCLIKPVGTYLGVLLLVFNQK
jgi:hypothetical protein